jgi:hypothetical protein
LDSTTPSAAATTNPSPESSVFTLSDCETEAVDSVSIVDTSLLTPFVTAVVCKLTGLPIDSEGVAENGAVTFCLNHDSVLSLENPSPISRIPRTPIAILSIVQLWFVLVLSTFQTAIFNLLSER